MAMKPDWETDMKNLLAKSIISLCEDHIHYRDAINVQGHLEFSVDDADTVVIKIDEKLLMCNHTTGESDHQVASKNRAEDERDAQVLLTTGYQANLSSMRKKSQELTDDFKQNMVVHIEPTHLENFQNQGLNESYRVIKVDSEELNPDLNLDNQERDNFSCSFTAASDMKNDLEPQSQFPVTEASSPGLVNCQVKTEVEFSDSDFANSENKECVENKDWGNVQTEENVQVHDIGNRRTLQGHGCLDWYRLVEGQFQRTDCGSKINAGSAPENQQGTFSAFPVEIDVMCEKPVRKGNSEPSEKQEPKTVQWDKRPDKTHCDGRPFICNECDLGFACAANLIEHYKSHEAKKSYKFNHCGKVYSGPQQYEAHGAVAQGKRKPFTCDKCRKAYKSQSDLDEHLLIHLDKIYVCDICGKSFSRAAYLKKHSRIHASGKRFMCEMCGKTYISKQALQIHELTHANIRPHVCDVCEKAFTRKTDLTSHIRIHTGEKKYVCDVCGKGFAQSSHYRKHYRIHLGIKPHKCDTCGKSFRERSTLKRHSMRHTGEKPYVCEVCGKAFAMSKDLSHHVRTHTGEKPFSCETCGKSFSHPANLRQHNFVHTDVKPFSCHICSKSFSQMCRLKHHYYIHNKDVKLTGMQDIIAGIADDGLSDI